MKWGGGYSSVAYEYTSYRQFIYCGIYPLEDRLGTSYLVGGICSVLVLSSTMNTE